MPIVSTFCAGTAVAGAAGDAVGDAVGDAAAGVATTAFEKMAESAGAWAGDMLVRAMTWWVQTPTVNPDNPAVRIAQSWTLPLAGIVLVVSVIWQASMLALSRKKEPLLRIGTGLLRYLVVTALGLVALGGAIQAGDELATAMVGETAKNFGTHMQGMLSREVVQNPFGLLVVGLLLGLLSLVQWILGFLRQAGILILAAMIPLAASGSLNESTKPWWPRLATAALALVAYKPMAAFIYMIGFTFVGEGRDLGTVMVGMMILFLSLFALPALMRFFSWAETRIGGGSGGGGGGLATGAALLAAGATARSGGGASAPAMASALQATGPGSQGQAGGGFGAIPGAPTGARAADNTAGPHTPGARTGPGSETSQPSSGQAAPGSSSAHPIQRSGATPEASGLASAGSPAAPSGAGAAGTQGSAAPGATTSGAGAAGHYGYQATQAAANEVTRGAAPPPPDGDSTRGNTR
ncbi:hypothetical protein DI005_20190 [Prauserella sp. PE36]|nr:hypothetical protein DI005_20190 [Prauserella sp. PE36]